MVLHYSPPRRDDHEASERSRRHLVALEQYPVRRTVYTDPERAARVVKILIALTVIGGAAVLSFTFGYALLEVLARIALVALLLGLIALIVILVVDLVKGPSA
jgi:hypothetical protein